MPLDREANIVYTCRMKLVHDYFYQLEHRRLRETYTWETILRHEAHIMAALHSTHEAQLKTAKILMSLVKTHDP